MSDSKINILIVHYNTPFLTECLIKSINKYVGTDCHIYIFDNSDVKPFTYRQDNLTVFDNTQGQIINFERELSKYPSRFLSGDASGSFISFKHCITVEKCISLIDSNFILMDSDVLLKRDISSLFDERYTFVGSIEGSMGGIRVQPYLCFINVDYLKKHNKHYLNVNFMHGLHKHDSEKDKYDTGRWFSETLANTNHRLIDINNFIIHYKAGSWSSKNEEFYKIKKYPVDKWLLDNKVFYTANYATSKIPCTKNEIPIYVSLTSWKERLQYLPEFFNNLLKQTMKPEKYILWLSSDEIKKDEVPSVLYTYPDLEICWVDKNLKSFKKFLTVEQNPSAINIILDDDRLYHKDTVKDLINAYENSDKKTVISYYTDICNSKGQPWGSVEDNDVTDYKWINNSCVLYPPNTFPMETFYYFTKVMANKPLVSDECFIMPFLIHHKLPISTIAHNLEDLNSVSPIIKPTRNSALHSKFFVEPRNFKTNKKNQLIWDICNELPVKYLKTYMEAFPNFGKDVVRKEKIIMTMTSWEKRISNLPTVLDNIYKQTMLPDNIVINLSLSEFPDKENSLPDEVVAYIEEHDNIIVNWIVGENTKVWKKIIPTFSLFPYDCTISMDDDLIYEPEFIETLYKKHLENPCNPISYTVFKNHGFIQHCGPGTLEKSTFYPENITSFLLPEVIEHQDSDSFLTFMAVRNGAPCVSVGSSIKFKKYNEVSPSSKPGTVNSAYKVIAEHLNDCFENYNPDGTCKGQLFVKNELQSNISKQTRQIPKKYYTSNITLFL